MSTIDADGGAESDDSLSSVSTEALLLPSDEADDDDAHSSSSAAHKIVSSRGAKATAAQLAREANGADDSDSSLTEQSSSGGEEASGAKKATKRSRSSASAGVPSTSNADPSSSGSQLSDADEDANLRSSGASHPHPLTKRSSKKQAVSPATTAANGTVASASRDAARRGPGRPVKKKLGFNFFPSASTSTATGLDAALNGDGTVSTSGAAHDSSSDSLSDIDDEEEAVDEYEAEAAPGRSKKGKKAMQVVDAVRLDQEEDSDDAAVDSARATRPATAGKPRGRGAVYGRGRGKGGRRVGRLRASSPDEPLDAISPSGNDHKLSATLSSAAASDRDDDDADQTMVEQASPSTVVVDDELDNGRTSTSIDATDLSADEMQVAEGDDKDSCSRLVAIEAKSRSGSSSGESKRPAKRARSSSVLSGAATIISPSSAAVGPTLQSSSSSSSIAAIDSDIMKDLLDVDGVDAQTGEGVEAELEELKRLVDRQGVAAIDMDIALESESLVDQDEDERMTLLNDLEGEDDEVLHSDDDVLPVDDLPLSGDAEEELDEDADRSMDAEDVEEGGEEEEEERQPVKVTARGRKGMKKKDKGKGKAIDQALLHQDPLTVDEQEGVETPVGSDHEEDNSDDAFVRRRAEAIEALTRIEIEFARLRDRLYVERMGEVERERIAVENGSHPELLHLTHLIEARRISKLDLAKRLLEGVTGTCSRKLDADEHTVWTWWDDGRAELRANMLDEANSKRRKLDREKRFIDRAKEGGLTPLLAPRLLPPVPLEHRRRLGLDAEPMLESEIAWSLKYSDLRIDSSVDGLDERDTAIDMERMGLREPVRVNALDTSLGSRTAPSFSDPRTVASSSTSTPHFTFETPYDPLSLQSHHPLIPHFPQNPLSDLPSLSPFIPSSMSAYSREYSNNSRPAPVPSRPPPSSSSLAAAPTTFQPSRPIPATASLPSHPIPSSVLSNGFPASVPSYAIPNLADESRSTIWPRKMTPKFQFEDRNAGMGSAVDGVLDGGLGATAATRHVRRSTVETTGKLTLDDLMGSSSSALSSSSIPHPGAASTVGGLAAVMRSPPRLLKPTTLISSTATKPLTKLSSIDYSPAAFAIPSFVPRPSQQPHQHHASPLPNPTSSMNASVAAAATAVSAKRLPTALPLASSSLAPPISNGIAMKETSGESVVPVAVATSFVPFAVGAEKAVEVILT